MPYQVGNRTIYYIGEHECDRYTNQRTKTGGPVNFYDIIQQYDANNKFTDPDFPTNDSSVGTLAFDKANNLGDKSYPNWDRTVHWKRPKDLVNALFNKPNANIVFCVSDSKDSAAKSRFDIKQASLGDCWFVASLSQIVQVPELSELVAPTEDNVNNNDSGAYHFRFYQTGIWVDVVVDDYLPCVEFWGPGQGWSTLTAKLTDQENTFEFWPLLAEKAYAKLAGSFALIEYNWPRFALEDLTGGISNQMILPEKVEEVQGLFDLLYNYSGITFVNFSAEKNQELGKKIGIHSSHAYNMTRLAKVPYQGKEVQLVRLRNPWGRDEWKGTWGDGDSKWNLVDEATKQNLGLTNDEDGEFWMEFEHAVFYYALIDICYWFPDNKFSLLANALDLQIYHSKWSSSQNLGGTFEFHLNPHFTFTIDGGSEAGEGLVLISQSLKDGLSNEKTLHGFTIFKVGDPSKWDQTKQYPKEFFWAIGENPKIKDCQPLEGGKQQYAIDPRVSSGWKLPNGTYVCVSMVKEANTEREFVLRLGAQKVSVNQ